MSRAPYPALTALLGALATAGALAAQPEPDRPPPGRTGGFGERTCHECHFEDDVNAGTGSLALDVPDSVAPGATVVLRVRLAHDDMRRAGFMLSVRTGDGAQAGMLRAMDERAQVTLENDVAYAHHTFAGTELAGDSTAWAVEWETAGLSAGDVVHIHFVGNAGNDDASPFGDFIYAGSREIVVGGR